MYRFKLMIGENIVLLLMVQKSYTTWRTSNPVKNGINYQPQLVSLLHFFYQQQHFPKIYSVYPSPLRFWLAFQKKKQHQNPALVMSFSKVGFPPWISRVFFTEAIKRDPFQGDQTRLKCKGILRDFPYKMCMTFGLVSIIMTPSHSESFFQNVQPFWSCLKKLLVKASPSRVF